jgi:hypothetical protein
MTAVLQRRRVKSGPHTVCANCGKKRKPPKAFKYVSRAEWERDPFCSRMCAEEANDVEPASTSGYGIDYGATARKATA